MYDIVAPVQYKDCITGNYPSFAAGLRTNENLDRTVRLHIHHKHHRGEMTYGDIMELGWKILETRIHIGDELVNIDPNSTVKECEELVHEGHRLRQFITEGLTVLPKLKTVSIGGIGEDALNDSQAAVIEKVISENFDMTSKTLPHALIDLPTVEFYCQAVSYGPLALPNKTIKPLSPIKCYTQHQRGTAMFTNCRCHQEARSPTPIVGAVNRYYGLTQHHVGVAHDMGEAGFIGCPPAEMFGPIIAMLNRKVYNADPSTGQPVPLEGDIGPDMHRDTRVHIYGYIRAHDSQSLLPSIFGGSKTPSNPLKPFQDYLERMLPQAWKGKVKLFNSERAPPCTGCGFSLQREHCISRNPDGYMEAWESEMNGCTWLSQLDV
jgi:hypothetical protein